LLLYNKKTVLIGLFAILLFFLLVGGCGWFADEGQKEPFSKDTILFSTFVEIQIHDWPEDEDPDDIISQAFTEMERTGSVVSVYDEDSDLSAINSAKGEPVEIEDDTVYLLETALDIYEDTGGNFDPTIGPLVQLWGFYTGDYRVPDDEEIAESLELVDATRIEVDSAQNTASIPKDMQLDIEALAKGYAARSAAEHLVDRNVESALITSGHSSIKAVGNKPDGSSWRIGLVHPRKTEEVYAAVELHEGESLSTSGDYQRYFEEDGRRYAHIVDPNTGYPPQNIQSVSVLTSDTVIADGLSTALFMMEPQKIIEFAKQRDNVSVVLRTVDGEVMYCPDIEERLEILE